MFVAPNVRPESDKWLTEEVAGNCAQPVEENRGQRAGANRNEGLKASSRLCTLGAAFVVDIDTDLPSHAVPEIVRKAKHGRVPRLFLQACDASAFSRSVPLSLFQVSPGRRTGTPFGEHSSCES